MAEQRKLEKLMISAKVEKGSPYCVIPTGYQPIRFAEKYQLPYRLVEKITWDTLKTKEMLNFELFSILK